jgi:hypothetical protein
MQWLVCHPCLVITRKNAYWWIIGAVAYVIFVPPIASIVTAAVVFTAYVISIQLHPHRLCRACKGTGRHLGAVWAYSGRSCMTCGGDGRHRRWGAQVFNSTRQVRGESRPAAARRRRARPL